MGANVQDAEYLQRGLGSDSDFKRAPEVLPSEEPPAADLQPEDPPSWIPARWWYLTPQHEVHGPFDWYRMTDWNLKRWFTPTLRILPEGFNNFYEIQQLYPMPRLAFVTEPLMPPGEFLPPTFEMKWWDLLFEACEVGCVEVVALLYSLGADIDDAQFDGWTPAQVAAGNGHVAVVQLLRYLGANMSAENDED
jgi:hypothetical protein